MSKSHWRRAAFALGTLALAAPGAVLAASADPVPGMPQLAFGHYTQGRLLVAQVVWLLIIFGLMYWLVKNIGLPKVEEVLEARQQRIQGDLEAAQRMKEEAEAAMSAHREATARARAEAQSAVAAAVQAAEAETQAKADALNARLNAQIAEAEERIARARASAMGALREVAADTTAAVVAKLVGRADPAAVSQAVDRELAARGRA
ncbi:MAG TPA: F0F1 ATP synthase subunit B' [Acetobacteraceae bacterium]|nr:F0F1 ATP synthase subunit B' [Acetobacteraceae bacterium]